MHPNKANIYKRIVRKKHSDSKFYFRFLKIVSIGWKAWKSNNIVVALDNVSVMKYIFHIEKKNHKHWSENILRVQESLYYVTMFCLLHEYNASI